MITQEKLMKVLDFIERYSGKNGFPPTVREICTQFSMKSTATAYSYINLLRERGLLEKADRKKRAVAVRGADTVRVPLIGAVTAGQPILAQENLEGYFPLPASEFGSGELFMLRVKGESMVEAGIYDGDKIVVKKQNTAENGDIVVAMFDSGTEGATVKRFFRRGENVVLHPENSAMTDFILDKDSNLKILGKVVGLFRSF